MKLVALSLFFPLLTFAQTPQKFDCTSTAPPANTVAVRLVFKSQLNWNFVVGNFNSASQICQRSGPGVAYDLDIAVNTVLTKQLLPVQADGGDRTAAIIYIPPGQLEKLRMDVALASSRLYNNPDATIDSLMDLVDPAFTINL